ASRRSHTSRVVATGTAVRGREVQPATSRPRMVMLTAMGRAAVIRMDMLPRPSRSGGSVAGSEESLSKMGQVAALGHSLFAVQKGAQMPIQREPRGFEVETLQ